MTWPSCRQRTHDCNDFPPLSVGDLYLVAAHTWRGTLYYLAMHCISGVLQRVLVIPPRALLRLRLHSSFEPVLIFWNLEISLAVALYPRNTARKGYS